MTVKSNLAFSYPHDAAIGGRQIWTAHDGIRTRDLFLTKEVLYRLSYMGARRAPTIPIDIIPYYE